MEWKQTNSAVKKRLCTQQAVKKVMMIVFWDMNGLITIDFQEKVATENNASYYLWNRDCLSFLFVIFQVLLFFLCWDPGGKEIVPYILPKHFRP